jgi:glycosidase
MRWLHWSPASIFFQSVLLGLTVPMMNIASRVVLKNAGRVGTLRLGTAALLAFSASTFPAYASKASIDVYPPNWWVGMEYPSVEVMLHGDNIANKKVSVAGEGVVVNAVAALDSPNYLFVTLDTSNAQSGNLIFTLTDDTGSAADTDGAEHLSHSFSYTLLPRKNESRSREGFSAKDAIYLITPDRFANGDASNDDEAGYQDTVNPANKGGRHGGDIQGIIDNLGYIADMGFTQIWTMPMLENAMAKYSYHGYSTTDFYLIDPRFGTNADYVTLSEKANEQGIGIIMDMVLNHIGSGHLWMEDTPSDDWINNEGSFVGTTHKRESLHDPHVIESDIVGFSDGWFVPTMPDLNQRNPHLANYLIQNAIWWVEYAGLSGIRVDTYSYSDKAFLSKWTTRLMSEYPNLNIVGEEWTTNPAITAYWQAGSHRYDEYVSALPSVMDFPLQAAFTSALTEEESWNSGLGNIYETLATDFLYGNPNNLVIFPDNHDMSRIFTLLGHDIDKWNMAMTFFLTTRGIPQVFYGTEILMANPDSSDHGLIRSDFPGGFKRSTVSKVNAFTGEGLSQEQRWAQQRVNALLTLRKDYPDLFMGQLKHYAPHDGVYTYFRLSEENDSRVLMVIMNKKEAEVSLARYSALLSKYKHATRLSDNTVFAVDDTLTLPPMSATVFVVN